MSWRSLDPSPFRAWIRWVPRGWPTPARAYFDLATHRIVWPAAGALDAGTPPGSLPEEPGLAYLPPVAESNRGSVEALASRLREAGSLPVLHATADADVVAEAPAVHWVDPIASWLARESPAEWQEAARLAPPFAVAVPLAGGLTPAGVALAAWIDAVAELAPVAVVGMAAELAPTDRRRIVEEMGESSFDGIFHGSAPSERDLARLVAARGLAPLPAVPELPAAAGRTARNRELAAALWEAAELALRLAAPEAECAALFAAARHLEASSLDVAALRREGNLSVLSWLAPPARGVVEDLLAGDESRRLAALRREWSGEDPS